MSEKFEDTKGVMRSLNKTKRTNNHGLHNTTLNIEQHGG